MCSGGFTYPHLLVTTLLDKLSHDIFADLVYISFKKTKQ
jgi:hypothetical protein